MKRSPVRRRLSASRLPSSSAWIRLASPLLASALLSLSPSRFPKGREEGGTEETSAEERATETEKVSSSRGKVNGNVTSLLDKARFLLALQPAEGEWKLCSKLSG